MFPFSLTRPIADCRLGIWTIREKWEKMLGVNTSTLTDKYLKEKFPQKKEDDNYWINGGLLPDENLITAIKDLKKDTSLVSGKHILVSRGTNFPHNTSLNNIIYDHDYTFITYPWELFQGNAQAVKNDFELLNPFDSEHERLEEVQLLIEPENIYVEEGAEVYATSINASEGPVYIGKNALVMEGAYLRGPMAIGEGVVVKMGAKIYGGTTIGPYSTVGGEVKNSVLFGFSNKAHDGYLGDSVLGEWCNLGAGTSNSNLRNTAGIIEVKQAGKGYKLGIKGGVMMGDYSRTAINTRIDSGTIIGVCAHLHEAGFPKREIPSFYWDKKTAYDLQKALIHVDNWMKLKGKRLSEEEKEILSYLYPKNH